MEPINPNKSRIHKTLNGEQIKLLGKEASVETKGKIRGLMDKISE